MIKTPLLVSPGSEQIRATIERDGLIFVRWGEAGQPDLPAVVTPQRVDSETQNQAAFAMIEYDLLDNLTLTAEGRYGEDNLHSGGSSRFSKTSNTGFVPGSSTIVGGAETGRTISATVKYAF